MVLNSRKFFVKLAVIENHYLFLKYQLYQAVSFFQLSLISRYTHCYDLIEFESLTSTHPSLQHVTFTQNPLFFNSLKSTTSTRHFHTWRIFAEVMYLCCSDGFCELKRSDFCGEVRGLLFYFNLGFSIFWSDAIFWKIGLN